MQFIFNYILLDAARVEQKMATAKELNPENICLYNKSEEGLDSVAPYLFNFTVFKEIKFISWFFTGWGSSWGTLVQSSSTSDQIHDHLGKFLSIKTQDGKEFYFRFYDPRVLKIFLRSCDRKQTLDFFGPISSFIVEGETKEEAILFKHKNGELIEEKIPASKVFGELAEEKTTESKVLVEQTEDKTPEIEQPVVLPEGKKPPRRFIY